MTIPKNRVRAKKPKTKTGCRTCRIRRIKCDEARPVCRRCTAGGWTCDGYDSKEETSKPPSTDVSSTKSHFTESCVPMLPAERPWYLPLSKLNYQEGLAFTFFRHHTANQLQDGIQGELWNRLVMQISHQEPVILHGIIAVGAMHNARSRHTEVDPVKLRQTALTSYSKAVVQLRDRISQTPDELSIGIVLLACVLFVSFEMLQHEIDMAMEHLGMGLKIMNDKLGHKLRTGRICEAMVAIQENPQGLMHELIPIFVRLDYAAPMYSRRNPMLDLAHDKYSHLKRQKIPTTFHSVQQAKSYLDLLSSGVFRLRGELFDIAERKAMEDGFVPGSDESTCYVRALSRSVDLGDKRDSILERKEALEASMATFRQALDSLTDTKEPMDRALMAIHMQCALVFFTIKTCREIHEKTYDGLQSLFEKAVDLASKYIRSVPGVTSCPAKRTISLEAGIIPTLFLIACKCRDQKLRTTAIDLVELGCRQEAMWDGMPFGAFLRHFAGLEEWLAALNSDSSTMPDNNGLSSLANPECARFSDVIISKELDELGRGKYTCARYRHESDRQIEITEHHVPLSQEKPSIRTGCKRRSEPLNKDCIEQGDL